MACENKVKSQKRFVIEVDDEFHKEIKQHALKQGHFSYRSWIMSAMINTMAVQKGSQHKEE